MSQSDNRSQIKNCGSSLQLGNLGYLGKGVNAGKKKVGFKEEHGNSGYSQGRVYYPG